MEFHFEYITNMFYEAICQNSIMEKCDIPQTWGGDREWLESAFNEDLLIFKLGCGFLEGLELFYPFRTIYSC